MRILLAIWPGVPRTVLVETMFHDVGERVTGDVPYPVKAENPAVKEAFEAMEERARGQMASWGVTRQHKLEPKERLAFKLAEFLEMMEYALDEISLGNRNMTLIAERCREQALRMMRDEELPHGVAEYADNYMQRRTIHERNYRSK